MPARRPGAGVRLRRLDTYVYIYIYRERERYTLLLKYMYVYVYVYVYVCVRMLHIHVCICIYIYIYIYIYVHTYGASKMFGFTNCAGPNLGANWLRTMRDRTDRIRRYRPNARPNRPKAKVSIARPNRPIDLVVDKWGQH